MQKMTMRKNVIFIQRRHREGRHYYLPRLGPTRSFWALPGVPCLVLLSSLKLPLPIFWDLPPNHRVQHKTLRVRPSLPPFGVGGRVGSSHCAPGASSFSIKVPAPPKCMTLASNPALLSLGFFFICKTETILG